MKKLSSFSGCQSTNRTRVCLKIHAHVMITDAASLAERGVGQLPLPRGPPHSARRSRACRFRRVVTYY
jgi:hypothetical protein